MAKKISELDDATSVLGSDIIPIINDGETRKISLEDLLASGVSSHSVTFYADGANLTAGTISTPIRLAVNSTIVAWTIIGNVAGGSAVVNIKKAIYPAYPTTVDAVGATKPTLTASKKNENFSLTSAVDGGSLLEFVLESVSLHTSVTVIIWVKP